MDQFKHRAINEARIRYLNSDFHILSPGAFVRCAVTGTEIPLAELKYWNVVRQEPYLNAQISYQREQGVSLEKADRTDPKLQTVYEH